MKQANSTIETLANGDIKITTIISSQSALPDIADIKVPGPSDYRLRKTTKALLSAIAIEYGNHPFDAYGNSFRLLVFRSGIKVVPDWVETMISRGFLRGQPRIAGTRLQERIVELV